MDAIRLVTSGLGSLAFEGNYRDDLSRGIGGAVTSRPLGDRRDATREREPSQLHSEREESRILRKEISRARANVEA